MLYRKGGSVSEKFWANRNYPFRVGSERSGLYLVWFVEIIEISPGALKRALQQPLQYSSPQNSVSAFIVICTYCLSKFLNIIQGYRITQCLYVAGFGICENDRCKVGKFSQCLMIPVQKVIKLHNCR